jgi:hypothetical protein
VENGGGGSFFAVDGGKKMGRWREGGKKWGEGLSSGKKSANGGGQNDGTGLRTVAGRTTVLGSERWRAERRCWAPNGGGQNDGAGLRTVVGGGKKMGRWREGGKKWGEGLSSGKKSAKMRKTSRFCFQNLNFFFFFFYKNQKKKLKTGMALST